MKQGSLLQLDLGQRTINGDFHHLRTIIWSKNVKNLRNLCAHRQVNSVLLYTKNRFMKAKRLCLYSQHFQNCTESINWDMSSTVHCLWTFNKTGWKLSTLCLWTWTWSCWRWTHVQKVTASAGWMSRQDEARRWVTLSPSSAEQLLWSCLTQKPTEYQRFVSFCPLLSSTCPCLCFCVC